MQTTSIEWTEMSVNPIRARDGEGHTGHYCEKISPGCKNCYASKLQRRFRMPEFQNASLRDGIQPFLDEAKLMEVLRRKKPTKIFWCDMSDLFGEWVPDEWIDKCFAVMALTPQHTHQVLTKRIGRAKEYLISRNGMGNKDICTAINEIDSNLGNRKGALSMPLPNVWLGVSCESQAAADERIPLLLQTPAAVRFVSAEPLLGPIDFTRIEPHTLSFAGYSDGNVGITNAFSGMSYFPDTCLEAPPLTHTENGIDQIIIGGESGKDARPMNIQWARDIIAQCKAANVAVFMKQFGSNYWADDRDNSIRLRDPKGGDMAEWPEELRIREFPKTDFTPTQP